METLPRNAIQPDVIRQALRHRWRTIALVTLLVTMVGVVLARAVSPTFTATTEILLKPTVGNALSPDSAKSSQQITIAMQTEAGLVSSPEVAALVSSIVGIEVLPASKAVTVTVPTNTQLVQIAYSADKPETAQQYASAFAKAVLANRQAQSKANVDQQLSVLNVQEKTAADNLKAATADVSVPSPGPDAVARVQLYTNRVSTLQESIGQVSATDVDPGSLVSPATLPASPAGLNPLLYIVIAAMLGFGLGAVLALSRELGDDRIRASAEAVIDGVPVLGTVNSSSVRATRDSYRQVRAGVLALTGGRGILSIATVASDETRADGSRALEIAAGIGRAVADAGYRTVVVDATLGRGHTEDVMPAATTGLSEVLEGITSVAESVVAASESEHLTYLGSGLLPEAARDLLASVQMQQMIAVLQADFDLVIVAGMPLGTSEGSDSALSTRNLVGVLTNRTTTHVQLHETVHRATQLGVRFLGLVELPRSAPARPHPSEGGTREVGRREGEEPESRTSFTGTGAEPGGASGDAPGDEVTDEADAPPATALTGARPAAGPIG